MVGIMEFKYNHYQVRLIQHPSATILRLEDSKTHQIYEATLLERAFTDYSIFGGLTFINRLLLVGLQKTDIRTIVHVDNSMSDRVRIKVSCLHAIFPTQPNIRIDLMALRPMVTVWDPRDVVRTTVKEGTVATMVTVWDPMDIVRTTVKESTVAAMEPLSKRLAVLEKTVSEYNVLFDMTA